MKNIVAKPNSRTTLLRLQFSVIMGLANMKITEKVTDWLVSEKSVSVSFSV